MSSQSTRTRRASKPKAPQHRSICRLGGNRIRITVDDEATTYGCVCQPHNDGVLYTLTKAVDDPGCEGEPGAPSTITYQCVISPTGDSCTCPGFTYRGKCKHVTGLGALTVHDQVSSRREAAPAPRRLPVCVRCKGTGRLERGTAVVECHCCDGAGEW